SCWRARRSRGSSRGGMPVRPASPRNAPAGATGRRPRGNEVGHHREAYMTISFPNGALFLFLCLAGCAGHHADVTADPWLRTRGSNDCARPACLFAVVVDSAGQPVNGVDIEIIGAGMQATTNTRGR